MGSLRVLVIVSFSVILLAQTPSHWTIAQPYGRNNPLKRALLLGTATPADPPVKVALLIDCHPEAGTPTIGIRLPDKGLNFDVAPFEGPDGIGTEQKLFRLSIADAPTPFRNINGSAKSKDTFQLDFMPSKAELNTLVAAASAGKPLVVTVKSATGSGPNLTARFSLPPDPTPLKSVVAPCLIQP